GRCRRGRGTSSPPPCSTTFPAMPRSPTPRSSARWPPSPASARNRRCSRPPTTPRSASPVMCSPRTSTGHSTSPTHYKPGSWASTTGSPPLLPPRSGGSNNPGSGGKEATKGSRSTKRSGSTTLPAAPPSTDCKKNSKERSMTRSRITTTVPGPKSLELAGRQATYVSAAVSCAHPVYIEQGEGSILTDVDGNEYLDFGSGIGVIALGHGNPRALEAAEQQLRKFTHTLFTVTPYELYIEV